MAELKPCKCKGKHIDFNVFAKKNTKRKTYYYYYSCPYCGKVAEPKTSKQQAIDAWNKRS